jgi:hypothetical protein
MKKPRGIRVAAGIFVLLLAPWSVTGQEAPLRFTTRAAEVMVGGRVQTQFSTTSIDPAVPALWEMRRVRLEMGVRLNPLVSARFNPEFAGAQIALRDAFVQFDLDPAAQIVVGQAFRPFGLIAQTSSVRILPVERGARFRGLTPVPLEHYNLVAGLGYADRDIGLQLRGAPRGAPLGLTYAAGVFNGPLIATAGGRGTYQLSARATVAPVPDVRIGAGWSRRDFGQAPAEGDPRVPLRAGTAWEVDLEYGNFVRGPHLMAEAAWGTQNPFLETQHRFRAAQLWAAYRTRGAGQGNLIQVEPLLRWSVGDPDATDADRAAGRGGGMLITPGVNLYFGPLNRIMVNYDLWRPRGGVAEARSFKAMFQIAF